MNTYRVIAKMVVNLETIIEAPDANAAWDIAQERTAAYHGNEYEEFVHHCDEDIELKYIEAMQ